MVCVRYGIGPVIPAAGVRDDGISWTFIHSVRYRTVVARHLSSLLDDLRQQRADLRTFFVILDEFTYWPNHGMPVRRSSFVWSRNN